MTRTGGDSARTSEAGRPATGPRAVGTAAPLPLAAGLAAQLGSEDTLFRDPFADFAPSGR
ncbi:MAG: hypothetical protein ABI742_08815 [Gemmatimonadota bacterium]